MGQDSDWTDLDDAPLTQRERKKLRAIIEEHEREQWARRRIRVFVPWAVGAVGAIYAFADWFLKYFQLRGKP